MPTKHSTQTTDDAPDSRAIFVVGAGRSGTSTITRGLQALGVELGRSSQDADGKKPDRLF